jgi:hypothetical protein
MNNLFKVGKVAQDAGEKKTNQDIHLHVLINKEQLIFWNTIKMFPQFIKTAITEYKSTNCH